MSGSRVDRLRIACSYLGFAALLLAACSPADAGQANGSGSPSQAGAKAPVAGGTVLPPPAANTAGAGSNGAISPDGSGVKPTAGSGGRSGAAGSGSTSGAGAGMALPCDVASVVAQKCAGCHGREPVGGAPMPLVTAPDFDKQIKSIRTQPGEMAMVASLVKKRINDASMPMPPGELLPEAERNTLNAWLDKGHAAATSTEAAGCAQPGGSTEMPTTKPSASGTRVNELGQTCYSFRNHGVPEPGDTTPYTVGPGEQYVSFYFKAPWTDESEIVSFSTIADNRKVLHHWLLYTTIGADMDGTFAPGIGTHLGDAAELLAGWAVGGSDMTMPKDVALRLPPPGAGVMIEWHFYNSDGLPEMDSSAAEICVEPKGTRKKLAGMTWLGTENFNGPLGMPARSMSQFGGTCLPSRAGMNDTDPIHIFALWPHMHKFGRHMNSVVTRADGTPEQVFDKPFDFNYQIAYDADIDLRPGDVITSTCTFENTSPSNVAFGPSTDQEMCYQFAYSYPAGALDNGVISLVGATNTCW